MNRLGGDEARLIPVRIKCLDAERRWPGRPDSWFISMDACEFARQSVMVLRVLRGLPAPVRYLGNGQWVPQRQVNYGDMP